MTPNQPYLLRAVHEWILDNNMTPHILVNADMSRVEVPVQSVQDGQIVLNLSPSAISSSIMDNEAVSFSARFSGVVEHIYIPVHAIKAIYASENGQGLVFPEADIISASSIDIDKDISEVNLAVEDKHLNKSADIKSLVPKKTPPFLKIIK